MWNLVDVSDVLHKSPPTERLEPSARLKPHASAAAQSPHSVCTCTTNRCGMCPLTGCVLAHGRTPADVCVPTLIPVLQRTTRLPHL
jgi:hypothetical protein